MNPNVRRVITFDIASAQFEGNGFNDRYPCPECYRTMNLVRQLNEYANVRSGFHENAPPPPAEQIPRQREAYESYPVAESNPNILLERPSNRFPNGRHELFRVIVQQRIDQQKNKKRPPAVVDITGYKRHKDDPSSGGGSSRSSSLFKSSVSNSLSVGLATKGIKNQEL